MEEKKEKPTFVFNFHGNVGQNIANVERMDVHFDKDMQMQVQNVENMNDTTDCAEVDVADDEFVTKLAMTAFYGMADEASAFLGKIRFMKPKEITDLVNTLVSAKVISDASHKRPLWSVLHDNGYYPPSESNWNKNVR